MKLLHQVGHNGKRNLESYFENNIGDGFIFNAYSFQEEKIGAKISGYDFNDFKDISLLDLQFFGGHLSNGGKLDTYDFHPIHSDITLTNDTDLIFKGIDYQINKGFKNIIIPNAYYKIEETQKIINIIKKVNSRLKNEKKENIKYYMTIPINNDLLNNENLIESILLELTNIDIIFDGYYIACEARVQARKKINDSFTYYSNLYEILHALKSQNFELIYAYSNFDALVFYSLVDIDYISFGTYENLRNFDISRFQDDSGGGGPSEGWYFSEKLLNMIKAKELINLRKLGGIDMIRNNGNIFSDEILTEGYIWNTHKPQIHKNYLLSLFNLFKDLSILELGDRKKEMISKVENARKLYLELESKGIYLFDESSDYHLTMWLQFLKSIK